MLAPSGTTTVTISVLTVLPGAGAWPAWPSPGSTCVTGKPLSCTVAPPMP